MIRQPVTFVIGAGASLMYGLPSGRDLLKAAVESSLSSDIYRFVQVVLVRRKIDPSALREFHEALATHPEDSIDAFLEKNQKEPFATIGKVVIAAFMGHSLTSANPHVKGEDDWLLHILQKMLRGADTAKEFSLGNAPVRFVTFNFDTFIEQRITQIISRAYKTTNPADWGNNPRPVVHVHGRFTAAHPRDQMNFNELRPDDEWIKWIHEQANQINVTSDKIETHMLREGQQALEDAGVICFLGFSYHPTNLKRLNVPETMRGRSAFGTALGITKSDRVNIDALFEGSIKLVDSNCFSLLQDEWILREH